MCEKKCAIPAMCFDDKERLDFLDDADAHTLDRVLEVFWDGLDVESFRDAIDAVMEERKRFNDEERH